MLFDEIYAEITKDKTEVFFKLYADKYGEGVLISIPDNFDDFLYCAFSQHLTVSRVKYRKFLNLYVQSVHGFECLKRLQSVFKFEIYDSFKKHRIDFSESDMICDNVYKHAPVSQFGMLCQSRYSRYFDKNDEPKASVQTTEQEYLKPDVKTVSVAAPDTAVESHKTEDALIKMEKKV